MTTNKQDKSSSSSKYILAYDADCGPCTRFAHIVDSLDKNEKIDFISLTVADKQGMLDKISAPLRYRSFHLISTNGEAKSGSDALLKLISILPGGKIISPIIDYFPGAKLIVRFIYNRFSKLHDSGSCRIDKK
ncbi:MAG TPA: DCC1-like thiol-disulfide oxidoreductase family protein [Nitrososphaeraceae archaeon]|nr:DCC1-like thiol-disulfide oxidoreductase family protein [Nitrososphaeraceae archaeon]